MFRKRHLLRRAVILCVSGGVDSAVAAALSYQCLHSARDVDALAMCCNTQRACNTLGIPAPASLSVGVLSEAIIKGVPLHQMLCTSQPHLASYYMRGDGADATPLEFRSVYMNNWRSDEHAATVITAPTTPNRRGSASRLCQNGTKDFADAAEVVAVLNRLREAASPGATRSPLSLSLVDFSEQYHHRCLMALLDAYANGATCNVDVLCNTHIKFGALLAHCKAFVAPSCWLVTGHYVRTVQQGCDRPTAPNLLAKPWSWSSGADRLNDQSHFLAELDPTTQLAHGLFPIGALFASKRDVREVALRIGLGHLAQKKTSTGLCFVDTGLPTSCRKQAAGTFPMWVHGMLHEEGWLLTEAPRTRRMRWVLLSSSSASWSRKGSDREEAEDVCTDVSDCVVGLHLDRREPLLFAGDKCVQPPAYAFTVGERVQVRMATGAVVPFYVVRKHLTGPHPPVVPQPHGGNDGRPRSIAVIVLCRTHAHPLLFERSVFLRTLVRHDPDHPAFEDPLQTPLYVAFRHLDPLRRCEVIPIGAGAGVQSTITATPETAAGVAAEVRLWADAQSMRCVPPGQLAVLYATVGRPTACGEQSGVIGTAHPDGIMAVVGCGWVA